MRAHLAKSISSFVREMLNASFLQTLRCMPFWNAEFVAGGLGAFGVSPVMKVVRLYIAFIRDGQPASTTAWLPLQFAQESCSGLGISSS